MLRAELLNMLPVPGWVGWKARTASLRVTARWREQLLSCRRLELPFRETLTAVMRNLTKFNTFEAQCPGLNKPQYHCQLAYWPAREPLCSRPEHQGKCGPVASPGGRRGAVLSVSVRV